MPTATPAGCQYRGSTRSLQSYRQGLLLQLELRARTGQAPVCWARVEKAMPDLGWHQLGGAQLSLAKRWCLGHRNTVGRGLVSCLPSAAPGHCMGGGCGTAPWLESLDSFTLFLGESPTGSISSWAGGRNDLSPLQVCWTGSFLLLPVGQWGYSPVLLCPEWGGMTLHPWGGVAGRCPEVPRGRVVTKAHPASTPQCTHSCGAGGSPCP